MEVTLRSSFVKPNGVFCFSRDYSVITATHKERCTTPPPPHLFVVGLVFLFFRFFGTWKVFPSFGGSLVFCLPKKYEFLIEGYLMSGILFSVFFFRCVNNEKRKFTIIRQSINAVVVFFCVPLVIIRVCAIGLFAW